jgi:hypothetical protein
MHPDANEKKNRQTMLKKFNDKSTPATQAICQPPHSLNPKKENQKKEFSKRIGVDDSFAKGIEGI